MIRYQEYATGAELAIDEKRIRAVAGRGPATEIHIGTRKPFKVPHPFDKVMNTIAERRGVTYLTCNEVCCLLMLFERLRQIHGEDNMGVMMKHGAFIRGDDSSMVSLCKKLEGR